jgi:Holliday junction DNA helicase RuvA
MIAYLNGKLTHKDPTFVIIECNGVGYLVRISLNTFDRIRDKDQVRLFTYFQVKEDSHSLYGFAEPQEKTLFEQLIGISGIGGNTAILVLSSMAPEQFYQAIHSGDLNSLKQIKGIGAKTAGRIILELKDKVQMPESLLGTSGKSASGLQNREEALAALQRLGLPKAEMEKRLDKIFREQTADLAVEEIIKLALRNN